MKKLLLALLALPLLLSGCLGIGSAPTVPSGEAFDPAYAYVTGRMATAGILYFSPVGDDSESKRVEFSKGDDYPVYKVAPGRYTCTTGWLNGNRIGGGMAEFSVKAGEFVYVGDLNLQVRTDVLSGTRVGNSTSYSASIAVWSVDRTEAAKNALRRNNPGLAGHLDGKLVYRPVTPMR